MGNDVRSNLSIDAGLGKEVFNEFKDRFEGERVHISKRLDDLEHKVGEISELTTSVQKLALSVQTMAETQKDQNERLRAIENKDGEMWRSTIKQIVLCIITGVVGFMLSKMGIV